MLLKEARGRASASIGEMISLGHHLLTPQVQTYMERMVLPLVIDKLPNLHFRIQKCYALLLTAAKLVGLINHVTSNIFINKFYNFSFAEYCQKRSLDTMMFYPFSRISGVQLWWSFIRKVVRH
jgi:hypothetical protein